MRTLKHAVTTAICSALILGIAGSASAQNKKPNIVVIWGDDTGMTNVSAYGHGIVGYKTPNIDRIAKEGVMFISRICGRKRSRCWKYSRCRSEKNRLGSTLV